jgi:hypothetical protein
MSLTVPRWGASVVRLQPAADKPGGWSEFRASYGGMYVTLHGAVLLSVMMQEQAGMASVIASGFAVGAGWLGMAIGRAVSMVADHPVQNTRTGYNYLGIGFELVMAFALMAPFIRHLGVGLPS